MHQRDRAGSSFDLAINPTRLEYQATTPVHVPTSSCLLYLCLPLSPEEARVVYGQSKITAARRTGGYNYDIRETVKVPSLQTCFDYYWSKYYSSFYGKLKLCVDNEFISTSPSLSFTENSQHISKDSRARLRPNQKVPVVIYEVSVSKKEYIVRFRVLGISGSGL